jgi:hypothetical protein
MEEKGCGGRGEILGRQELTAQWGKDSGEVHVWFWVRVETRFNSDVSDCCRGLASFLNDRDQLLAMQRFSWHLAFGTRGDDLR